MEMTPYRPFLYADIDVKTIAKLSLVLNCPLTIAAFLFLNQDVNVLWESFSGEFQKSVLVAHNYTMPLTIREVLALSVPSSPHFHVVESQSKRMMIQYGSGYVAACWNDPAPLTGLPSIHRLLELHSLSQLLLRFTFLWSLSVRPILGTFRALAVFNRLKTKQWNSSSSFSQSGVCYLNRVILILSPPISFLVLVSGYFVTACHQDLDQVMFPMWKPFYSFAFLYSLHMFLHTTIELLEPERMSFPRVLSRFALTSVFIITSIIALRTCDEFFVRKSCHVIVSTRAAIAEYLCILSITIFSLLEWTDVWNLNIIAEDNGIDPAEIDNIPSSSSV